MARPHLTEEGYIKNFWAGVQKGEGCWEWQRSRLHHGHGQFFYKGKRVQAHRFSYQVHYGALQEGLMVLHRCNNGSCVRPDHIYAGTHTDNMKDCADSGIKKGAGNPAAKISEADVQAIRDAFAARESGTLIAKRYNLSATQVYSIKNRKSWGHVP